jgi:hypothetical protein
VALTRANGRQRVYRLGIGMGTAITADAVHEDGVSWTGLQNGPPANMDWARTTVYRPALSAPDRDKPFLCFEGQVAVHNGTPYTDALSELAVEFVGLISVDEFNDVFRRALRHVYFEQFIPISPFLDGDFSVSSLTSPYNWTASASNTTPTKITTGGVATQMGQSGPRNLVLTNSSASGYVPTSNVYLNDGDTFVAGAIGRCNGAYTGSVVLYDVTNSVALWTITFTSRGFVRVLREYTVTSDCEVELRIGGTEASAVTEWDCLLGHLAGQDGNLLVVPTYLNERGRTLGFGPAYYGRQLATYVNNATSRQYVAWDRDDDYVPLPLSQDASTSQIQIKRDGGAPTNSELWLHALRPFSDIEDLDNETDSTDAPEDMFMESVKYELGCVLANKYPNDGWQPFRDEAWRKLEGQRNARGVVKTKREQTYWSVSI